MTSIRTNPATSAQFAELLSGWNRETAYLSVGNFNNRYFDEIVEMKEDAVPYIYEELKKGPTLLVHALDRIYPDKVQCEGYVPLTTVCNVWLNILSKIGTAWDIHHSGGELFAGSEYGSIFAYMKRPISERYLTDVRKPQIGKILIKED